MLNGADYTFLADFLRRRSGLSITSEKAYLIESRLKPIASTDGCHLEVKRCVFGMTAGIDEIFSSFHRLPDLHQFLILWVLFPKVGAEATLSFMNVQHRITSLV